MCQKIDFSPTGGRKNRMSKLKQISKLVSQNSSKILMIVMDGLGGLPFDMNDTSGKTELETARTPNLDKLAAEGICGLHLPVGTGLTPGSGPAHLGLFGYDPLEFQIGRGALEAVGIGFDLKKEDVAARGNFCTVDDSGKISDRRAGRIDTSTCQKLSELLNEKVKIEGVEVIVQAVREHRFLLVLRSDGLSDAISETDPQRTGTAPLAPEAFEPKADKTSSIIADFVEQAAVILKDQQPANMLLLRGFSQLPDWPLFHELFGLKACAIAAYPMYRGVAKLVGMEPFEVDDDLDKEFALLEQHWQNYDFFFLHMKQTDSAGEDGDFDKKVALIEGMDRMIPRAMKLKPDVIIVTGDHSTPAIMKKHSWHPVPLLLWSKLCRPDNVKEFGERACLGGSLGASFPVTDIMLLALANAGRLEKFGA